MKIPPNVAFWLGVVTTIAQGIAAGTVHLTGLVPDYAIPTITGWLGLIVFVNMSIMTAMSGFSSAQSGPLAAAPTLDEARKITDIAKAASSAP